jgi:hypothetical protein
MPKGLYLSAIGAHLVDTVGIYGRVGGTEVWLLYLGDVGWSCMLGVEMVNLRQQGNDISVGMLQMLLNPRFFLLL